MEIKIVHGNVLSFDSATSRGKVSLAGETKAVDFHSTCFQSSLPTRFPESGEAVKVTFDQDRLVSVRSAT